jgi:hypothetical protein
LPIMLLVWAFIALIFSFGVVMIFHSASTMTVSLSCQIHFSVRLLAN